MNRGDVVALLLLTLIPCIVLFFQFATGWLVKTLEHKIEAVSGSLDRNLKEAQVMVNDLKGQIDVINTNFSECAVKLEAALERIDEIENADEPP